MNKYSRWFTHTLLYIIISIASTCRLIAAPQDSILPTDTATQNSDSLEVALLTCSPGQEVYSLYGHTALRIQNTKAGTDWVFNYGVFSFNQPHFIWRFTQGKCDYQIGAIPYFYFIEEYIDRGSAVYAQTLNLTPQEEKQLWDNLVENMRPENRVYRYNYLYDNCTTRARDQIERAVNGTILYPNHVQTTSYRKIIHQFTTQHPWAELGNDICLGAEADKEITQRQEMFAPYYLMNYAQGAAIKSTTGQTRSLVLHTDTLCTAVNHPSAESNYPTPSVVFWSFFAILVLCSAWEIKSNKSLWLVDVLVMLIAGIVGIIATFLFFGSQHPTVGSNWQIWVFNPTHIIALPWVVFCAIKHRKTVYHWINLVVLTLFILFSAIIPQDFCVLVVPLALCLLLRSCTYIIKYKNKRNDTTR